MASSLKFLCFFFLLTTLSSQIHARDSQFFSKVSRNREPDTTTTATTTHTNTNTNNALKETEFVPLSSFKQQDKVEEEENPAFLPETEGSGYGFYGHETGLDPPSTTTTTNNNNNNIHDHEMNYAKELKGLKEYNNNDNNNFYLDNNNNKVVDQGKYYPTYEKQGMSDTRFMENGKYSYNGGAGYYGGAEKQEITDFPENTTPKFLGSSKYHSTYGGAGSNGGQRQGMSDTRFLENGKYFYDVNSKFNNNNKYYNPNNYNNNNKYYNPDNYNNNNNKFYNPDNYNNNNKFYNPDNYNNNKYYNPDNYNNNKYYNPNNYNNEYMVKNNGYYGNYKENSYGEFYNNNNGYKNQVPEEEEFDFDP